MSHVYQGHLPDGSSIQRHSAGGLYPYVIFAKQQGDALRWGYMSPDGVDHLVSDSYDGACESALAHKEAADRERQFKAARDYLLNATGISKTPRVVEARSRHDIAALVTLRKMLEEGAAAVRMTFASGDPAIVFTPADLPGVRWKVICNM